MQRPRCLNPSPPTSMEGDEAERSFMPGWLGWGISQFLKHKMVKAQEVQAVTMATWRLSEIIGSGLAQIVLKKKVERLNPSSSSLLLFFPNLGLV